MYSEYSTVRSSFTLAVYHFFLVYPLFESFVSRLPYSIPPAPQFGDRAIVILKYTYPSPSIRMRSRGSSLISHHTLADLWSL